MKILITESQYRNIIEEIELNEYGSILKNLFRASKSLKTIAPVTKEFVSQVNLLKPQYIERFGLSSYNDLIKNFKSGVVDKNKLISTLSSASKSSPKLANFVTKYGIKFTKDEVKGIHDVTTIIKNTPSIVGRGLFKLTPITIRVQTLKGLKDVEIKLITSDKAVKLWGNKYKDTYGAAWGNEIYIVIDNVKKMHPKDIDQLFYHEITHIKDPSTVSSKLDKIYNSNVVRNSPEYFSKGYYFHQKELVANTSKILQGLSTNTKKIMGQLGKQKTLQGLDDIINWSKVSNKELSGDAIKLLGYDQPFVKEHLDNLKRNPKELINLKSKIAQQSEYIKSQVKLSLKENDDSLKGQNKWVEDKGNALNAIKTKVKL